MILMDKKADRKTGIRILDGNQAAAQGAKLSRVQVIAAYPITPQTPLTEALSEFVEREELNAEYVAVEGEHSAMAVCTSASTVGARTFTATSSHGLAYMHEMLHWAAGARLPIVLACVNRPSEHPGMYSTTSRTPYHSGIPAGYRYTPGTTRRYWIRLSRLIR